MEVENMVKGDEEAVVPLPLPGFRFHPTDEELVGFYLTRKVEKKPLTIDLIKHADIYKYDPWDLPKSTNIGEKDREWYFFCKRGRKYKNSVRPNRVTRSGFWKATGIDRPIYSGRDCIGLKKSLVYYRGCAGKGTKTEWMMHEFRLPANHLDLTAQLEAEVWTLCRILKRNTPHRKHVPDFKLAVKKMNKELLVDATSETCSMESSHQSNYISFRAPMVKQNIDYPKNPYSVDMAAKFQNEAAGPYLSPISQLAPAASSFSAYNSYSDINELLRHAADWEDLQSLVNCPNAMYM